MKPLTILKTEIHIGIEHPFRVLHITDSHISLWDEYDAAEDKDKPGLAIARRRAFDNGEDGATEYYYEEALAYAKRENLPIVHTGDLVDFLSHANFAYMDKTLGRMDYFYAAGNHDFCHFVGRATEDYAYKWKNIKIAAPHVKQNLYFASEVRNGVNFVAMDDTYYLLTDGQTELLRAEAAKGLPIILFMHVPLYSKDYAEVELKENPCAYLTGAPKELCDTYPEDRRLQQTPDEATLRCIDYIKSEPLIKALVVGHTHRNYEAPLDNGVMQITTHGSFAGYVRELIIT
ncbi:MAG: metallophosphoesterase [Clostridia bacterium]|nr:metallophosphoesterase [Clostridia bacterium]